MRRSKAATASPNGARGYEPRLLLSGSEYAGSVTPGPDPHRRVSRPNRSGTSSVAVYHEVQAGGFSIC